MSHPIYNFNIVKTTQTIENKFDLSVVREQLMKIETVVGFAIVYPIGESETEIEILHLSHEE